MDYQCEGGLPYVVFSHHKAVMSFVSNGNSLHVGTPDKKVSQEDFTKAIQERHRLGDDGIDTEGADTMVRVTFRIGVYSDMTLVQMRYHSLWQWPRRHGI